MKHKFVIWCCTIASLFVCQWSIAHESDNQDVRTACQQLIMDYAYFRDRGDADGFARLFTHDAELKVLDDFAQGREAIAERIRSSPPTLVLRHLISTIRIEPLSSDRARATSYATIYTANKADAAARPPFALSKPAAVGEYHDVCVKTPTGWKIQSRTFVPVLAPAPSD